jgi:hypothetical protein
LGNADGRRCLARRETSTATPVLRDRKVIQGIVGCLDEKRYSLPTMYDSSAKFIGANVTFENP